MARMVIYFDGGCLGGNRFGKAYGSASFNGKIETYDFGVGSNNEAEYKTFHKVLDYLIENKIKDALVYGDSALVINQVLGINKVNAPHLKPLKISACKKMKELSIDLVWVPRETILEKLGH